MDEEVGSASSSGPGAGAARGGWSTALGVIAAIVSIGAGAYLLSSESASADSTVFDVLMHGIGAYFVARGLWMVSALVR